MLDDAEVARPPTPAAAPATVLTRRQRGRPVRTARSAGPTSGGRDASRRVLDDAEVLDTAFVCAAAPAPLPAVLSVVVSELPDATCPFGGSEIRSGPDLDGNGTLDAAEVTVVRPVCETRLLPSFTFASADDMHLFEQASIVKGDVTVQSPTLDLVSLDVDKILGSIVVAQNPKLTSLTLQHSAPFGELSVLVSGSVLITDNPVLTSIEIGNALGSSTFADSRIAGSLIVARNASLATTFFGLTDLASVDRDLVFQANDSLSELRLDGLRSVGGDLKLAGNARLGQGQPAFITATTVGGTVILEGPGPVNSIEMFNLQAAGGILLTGVTGGSLLAPNLRVVFGDVHLLDDPLAAVQFSRLLEIEGTLRIMFNGMTSLNGFFPALEHVGRQLQISSNAALFQLDLGALRSATDVFLNDDPKLPTCAAQKLVAQLSPPPTSVSISGTDDTGTCP